MIPNKMKAITYTKYGPPEVLQLTETDKPIPKDNEVLVRIKATAVNSGDIRLRKADPFAVRFMFGLFKPKKNILGVVYSGEIEEVGRDVTHFKVGDPVFGSMGMKFGTYAEYICISEDGVLAIKPKNITHTEAASIPFGGTTALSFIRKGKLKASDKILIYGASGAVGTAAIQIAKYLGAHVTGVCSTTNIEMVRAIGSDRVIDYTKEDFTKETGIYDVVLDTIGKSPFSGSLKSLKKKGYYVRVVHMSAGPILKGIWSSMISSKKVIGGSIKEKAEDLLFLNKMIEAGKLKAVIDRTYPLGQIAEAHTYVERGHKKGNVVITLD
ncbi:MAG TPA: NAD(P)-dependent alcohol dehydrogenase [Chitinophagaceae bacterium]|nr:NAD(P)-dependent alcohol dehydrogenase [Chitinophagaceae bacterium]